MPRLTILQPHPTAPAGRLTRWFDECSTSFDVVDLQRESVPPAEQWGDGAVVLGGKMNALDDAGHPWIADLRVQLRAAVERGLPVLCICLGHQILASAFGGEVVVAHPAGGEHGVHTVVLLDACAADPVLGHVYRAGDGRKGNEEASILAYESHYDAVVTLPEGATLLAGSQLYPIQAFRIGSALGLQFHPERTPELMASHRQAEGMLTDDFLPGLRAVDATVFASARKIAHGFAAQCGGRAAGREGGAARGDSGARGDGAVRGGSAAHGDSGVRGDSAAHGGSGAREGRAMPGSPASRGKIGSAAHEGSGSKSGRVSAEMAR